MVLTQKSKTQPQQQEELWFSSIQMAEPGFSIAKNYSEGEACMLTRYQYHNRRARGRTCNEIPPGGCT